MLSDKTQTVTIEEVRVRRRTLEQEVLRYAQERLCVFEAETGLCVVGLSFEFTGRWLIHGAREHCELTKVVAEVPL